MKIYKNLAKFTNKEIEYSFAVTTNFKYNPIPKGFVEITKEEYERLQEELNDQKEETTTE